MTREFGAKSTADDVLSGVDLKEKRIPITGVSSGIGLETGRSLASHGASIVGADLDLAKAEAATAPIDDSPNPFADGVRSYALDANRAKQLWAMSEALINVAA